MPSTNILDATAHRQPSWKRLALFTLLAGLLLSPLLLSGSAWAEPDAKPAATSKLTDFTADIVPVPVKLTEAKPAPKAFEQVNGFFEVLVHYLDMAFFKKLWAGEEQTITVVDRTFYVRAPGAGSSFDQVDIHGNKTGEQLTIQQAEAFEARGMLEVIEGVLEKDSNGDMEQRTWRGGEFNGNAVEYVTVVNTKPTTYVSDEWEGKPVFRKRLSKRALLTTKPEEMLTAAQAAALGSRGQLVLNTAALEKSDSGDSGTLKPGVANAYVNTGKTGGIPLIVLWLATGSLFFTFYMGFVNIWGFRHALSIVGGRYDDPNEPGEVTHLQALSSALSATVGLGNIAGVTIAMTLGGPGAFFWMLACGFFGMTSKFVECTLGQKYRTVKPDGTILGGPMQYLSAGLKELGLGPIGPVLGVFFAILCIIASFGGGNMFQANQSGATILYLVQSDQQDAVDAIDAQIEVAAKAENFEELEKLEIAREKITREMANFSSWFRPIFGCILAGTVGLVIIGGIKRIGAAAEKIVPTMCGMYILACLYVILSNIAAVPELFASIFSEAFSGQAFGGGMVGILVIGVQRAAFSNEAGVGSAAIAHSAAKTDEPVREGAVALLGPFIDTIVICSMTALVILITGAWDNDAWLEKYSGAALASEAFKSQIKLFPYVLTVAIVLFAYSTIVSWSYYGERCWERLFGARTTIVYKCLFIGGVLVGAVVDLGAVLTFSDIMILAMAFPNVLGAALLAPKVKRDLADYWRRYKANEFKTFK